MKYSIPVILAVLCIAAFSLFLPKKGNFKLAVLHNRAATVSVHIGTSSPECYSNDEMFDKCGATGVIVAYKNGKSYILTNRHVAEAAGWGDGTPCPIWVFPERSKKGLPGIFISVSPYTDLALIEVSEFIAEPVKIAKEDTTNFLDKVFSVGNPGCVKDVVGFGHIGTKDIPVYEHGDGIFLISDVLSIPSNVGVFMAHEMFLPSTGGSSGSGIYNEDGELIAVLFGGARVSPSFTLAVPLKAVQAFLEAKGL